MNVQALPTTCEKCGGNGHWDNRKDKKNPKAPDFKCKNKACGNGVWLAKGHAWADQAPAPSPYAAPEFTSPNAPDFLKEQVQHEARTVQQIQQGADRTARLQSLFALYDVCLDHAASVAATTRLPVETVPAMAATLFIAAKDKGLAA